MNINYVENDIHDEIIKIPDNTFELIYTDPPFNVTGASWEKPLQWDLLFRHMWRVLKPNGIIVLHASIPFTYELLKYQKPKYHWIWIKNNSTGFFQCKRQPLRSSEEVFVYYKKTGTYNPQMIGNKFYPKRNVKYGGQHEYWGKEGVNKDNVIDKDNGHYGRYPNNVLNYNIRKDNTGITRPNEMIDFFIKTYTNEGDSVLDMTCHNNYVGDRCKILNRNYLGIDIKLCLNNET